MLVPLPGKPATPACLTTGHKIPPSAGSAAPPPGQCHQHDSPLEGADREREGAVTHRHTYTVIIHTGTTGLAVGGRT